MLLDSSTGQTGDRVILLSPKMNITKGSSLSFYYHMLLNDTDTVGALTVYRYTQLLTYDRVLFTATGNHGQLWHQETVCLPTGKYQLAFVGVVGLPSLSDIAVDAVDIDDDEECCCDDSHYTKGNLPTVI